MSCSLTHWEAVNITGSTSWGHLITWSLPLVIAMACSDTMSAFQIVIYTLSISRYAYDGSQNNDAYLPVGKQLMQLAYFNFYMSSHDIVTVAAVDSHRIRAGSTSRRVTPARGNGKNIWLA